MFYPNAEGKWFGLDQDVFVVQQQVDVFGRMTCGENEVVSFETVARSTADGFHPLVFYGKINDPLVEMHFTASFDDLLPDVLDDAGQFVGANVWMGSVKDGRVCTKMNEQLQYFVDIAAFGASGIKLAIAISAGTAFAKTIVAVFVQYAFLVQGCKVSPSFPHIFSALQDDGLDALLNQFQGSEKACWSCANDQGSFC